MIALEEIRRWPLAEKLRVMEIVWEDLARRDEVEVPDWHKELLDGREKLVESGATKFVDWEEAKKMLRSFPSAEHLKLSCSRSWRRRHVRDYRQPTSGLWQRTGGTPVILGLRLPSKVGWASRSTHILDFQTFRLSDL